MPNKNEKTANRAAVLTLLTILMLGYFFPLVTFGYLAGAASLLLLSNGEKDFSALVVVFLPVVVIYCAILTVHNYQQVVAHCKAKVQEVVKHFV
jgi:fumarate reductase subunit D